jgi:hypothetical protein
MNWPYARAIATQLANELSRLGHVPVREKPRDAVSRCEFARGTHQHEFSVSGAVPRAGPKPTVVAITAVDVLPESIGKWAAIVDPLCNRDRYGDPQLQQACSPAPARGDVGGSAPPKAKTEVDRNRRFTGR